MSCFFLHTEETNNSNTSDEDVKLHKLCAGEEMYNFLCIHVEEEIQRDFQLST